MVNHALSQVTQRQGNHTAEIRKIPPATVRWALYFRRIVAGTVALAGLDFRLVGFLNSTGIVTVLASIEPTPFRFVGEASGTARTRVAGRFISVVVLSLALTTVLRQSLPLRT